MEGDAAQSPLRRGGRTILALGGHEFSRRHGNEAIRDLLLSLVPERGARICLLPTASGDAERQITAFRSALAGEGRQVSHLSLFRLEAEPVVLAEHLLAQDLIYVGGGSLVNLLAIWRAHGLHEIMRDAWESGVVLAGQSAGALCWFETPITRSSGGATATRGLGLIPGALSVHYHRDPDRQRELRRAVARSAVPGYGLDDQAGILLHGEHLAASFSARPGAGVWRVEPSLEGGTVETRLDSVILAAPRPPIDEASAEVQELRLVRAIRSRRQPSPARMRGFGRGASGAPASRRSPGS